MKRLLLTVNLCFLLLFALPGTSHALTVTLAKGTPLQFGASAIENSNYIVLTFSNNRVIIHDTSTPVAGKTLSSREVSLAELFLIRDHRPISQRTGYSTIYSYGLYKLGIVERPQELAATKHVTLWPISQSMVVTSKPALQIQPDPTVQKAMKLLSRTKYLEYMEALAKNRELPTRYSCATEALTARDAIVKIFKTDTNLVADATKKFINVGCTSCSENLHNGFNVIAEKIGWKYPKQFYLVGAHYDSINNDNEGGVTCEKAPGACDNASGVAGVLELARVFNDLDTESSVIFVAFGGEEIGFLGSEAYVDNLVKSGKKANLKGFVILDMISYYKNDRGIYIEASDKSKAQTDAGIRLKEYADAYTTLKFTEIYWKPANSDHVPFLDEGITGGLLIQKECESSTYPYLHSAEDVITLQKPDFAIEVLKVAFALLAESKISFQE